MVGDGAPDLRNLFVHFCPCEEGDMLILLSGTRLDITNNKKHSKTVREANANTNLPLF